MIEDFFIGEGCKYTDDTSRNGNIVVVGTSGSGKTMSVAEERLLRTHKSSFMAMVSKKKLIEKYAPVFLSRGYDVHVIDFVHPEKSTCFFDPLSAVHSQSDIQSLSDFIIQAQTLGEGRRGSNDAFWDISSSSLLSALIYFVKEKKRNATFVDVIETFNWLKMEDERNSYGDHIKTSLDEPFEELAKKNPGSFGVGSWENFHQLAPRTASSVYGSLFTAIYYLFTDELCQVIRSKPPVCIEQVAQRKTALFVYTSAVTPTLNHLSKLFYSQAIKGLFEFAEDQPEGKLPISVSLLCDDFANGGQIQDFAGYISIFREKGISSMLLFQDETQLQNMYGPENANTIVNNSDTYVFMGCNDISTCETVSRRANIPFEEVSDLPLGQEIILQRGRKACRTDRYHILEDQLYQKVTDRYENQLSGWDEPEEELPEKQ